MKYGFLNVAALAIFVSMGMGQPSAFAQGSLTPPGAPDATMKTLSQIEPRTAISSVPYTITNSGSYYLTASMTSSYHGVIIRADAVTLDLMGFSLTGDGGAGSDIGVFLDGETNRLLSGITVRGGAVSRFQKGISCEYVRDIQMKHLAVSSNNYAGIYLFHADGSSFSGCTIGGNDGFGISMSAAGGCAFDRCAISDNASYGVYIDGQNGSSSGNSFAECSISGNRSYGVYMIESDGNTLHGCVIAGNRLAGISLASRDSSCIGNMVDRCVIGDNQNNGVWYYSNSGAGSCSGNTIRDCVISGHTFAGIRLAERCSANAVSSCTLYRNGKYGITIPAADGNRIENNTVSRTTNSPSFGINTGASTNNLIVQNFCTGLGNNFSCSTNDLTGPIVTAAGILPATNGAAALSSWANFSR